MSYRNAYDLSWMSEEEYPVTCGRCGYNLTGLGEEGQCPECSQSFERADRLWTMYRYDIVSNDHGLDSMPDLSHVDPERFPILCQYCGEVLRELQEKGRCPRCDRFYTRRNRLWEIYGPEAFMQDSCSQEGEKSLSLKQGLLLAALVAVSPIVISFVWWTWADQPSIVGTIVVWVIFISACEGFICRRSKSKTVRHNSSHDKSA